MLARAGPRGLFRFGRLESLERVKQEYADEPIEQVCDDLKKKLELMNTDLKEAQAHLKLFEASLQQLKPKSQRQE